MLSWPRTLFAPVFRTLYAFSLLRSGRFGSARPPVHASRPGQVEATGNCVGNRPGAGAADAGSNDFGLVPGLDAWMTPVLGATPAIGKDLVSIGWNRRWLVVDRAISATG